MRRHLTLTLCAGFVLAVWSEWLFWLGQPFSTPLPILLLTWLLYSAAAHVLLLAWRTSGARTWPVMFLCGALYGWVTEGLLVQTMVADLPFSLSLTGLGWHALISVLVGWGAVRRALASSDRATLLWLGGLGLFYGVWAAGWWANDVPQAAVGTVALTTGALSAGLMLAYGVAARLGDDAIAVGRASWAVAFVIVAVLFVVAVLAAPLTALVFPLCAGVVVALLWRARGAASAAPSAGAPLVPGRRLTLLGVFPAVVTGVYALLRVPGVPFSASSGLAAQPLIYAVLLLAGFALLAASAWRVLRPRRALQ